MFWHSPFACQTFDHCKCLFFIFESDAHLFLKGWLFNLIQMQAMQRMGIFGDQQGRQAPIENVNVQHDILAHFYADIRFEY